MDCSIALRLIFVIPAIFLASYIAFGLLFALISAIWPYLLGGIALLVALVLLAVKAS